MSTIDKTIDHVKQLLYNDGSGHDWWHIYRVWNNAKSIAKQYPNADHTVIELTALLHDIADWKDHDGDEEIGPNTAMEWLKNFKEISADQRNQICHIIRHMSFKGANVEEVTLSLEGQIVQDADRLDAIGAVGIARTFSFGGSRGNLMHDPTIKPANHSDKESYYASGSAGTTINHFYEKLLLLKDRMNTEEGKKIATERHEYMQGFLNQFYHEWAGDK